MANDDIESLSKRRKRAKPRKPKFNEEDETALTAAHVEYDTALHRPHYLGDYLMGRNAVVDVDRAKDRMKRARAKLQKSEKKRLRGRPTAVENP